MNIKYIFMMLLCFASFSFMLLTMQGVKNNQNQRNSLVAEQLATIEELKEDLSNISVDEEGAGESEVGKVETPVQKFDTGLDITRMVSDDKMVEDFLRNIMSWTSYSQYRNIRMSVMEDYGIPSDSDFMQVYLPHVVNTILVKRICENCKHSNMFEISESEHIVSSYSERCSKCNNEIVIQNSDVMRGKQYNRIDLKGINVNFEDMYSYVISIDKDSGVYSYISVVTWSTNRNGAEAFSSDAVMYSTDADGNMFDLAASVLARANS